LFNSEQKRKGTSQSRKKAHGKERVRELDQEQDNVKWFSLFLTESLDKQGTNGDIGLLWFVTNKQLQIERCLFLACVSHEAAVKTESTRTKRCEMRWSTAVLTILGNHCIR